MDWRAPWIWHPEASGMANTFVLFRLEVEIEAPVLRAVVALTADTRYTLYVNGREFASGPPPYDPRWPYYDELDIACGLHPGTNVIGVRVCYFGQHDGTAIAGPVPGFMLQGEAELADDSRVMLDTDPDRWTCHLATAWRSGTRRWLLRSLNEVFDARLLPSDWLLPGQDDGFERPVRQEVPPGRPLYLVKSPGDLGYDHFPRRHDDWRLIRRDIPFMEEHPERPVGYAGKGTMHYLVPPEDYYQRGRYRRAVAHESAPGSLEWPLRMGQGEYAILDYGRLRCGRIELRLEAPAGTVLDLSFDERRRTGTLLTPTPRLKSWARYVCRDGGQHWVSVDYESLRYLQIVVTEGDGPVTIGEAVIRHRRYPVQPRGHFRCSDPRLNRLWDVTVHTVEHTCHEQIVDNNLRERQAYSGDIEWGKLALYYLWGDAALAAKGLRQFAQGQQPSGQFMPCWPTGCRLEILGDFQMGAPHAGYELVDHSLQYVLGVWHHYLFTGDRELLAELYPALRRFHQQLVPRLDSWGMVDPDTYGEGWIYIDHTGWGHYRDPMASTAMVQVWAWEALADMAQALGQPEQEELRARAGELRRAIVSRYFRPQAQTFVINPDGPGKPREHESTLALAILLGLVPDALAHRLLDRLFRPGEPIGRGTPVSANFVLRAAARLGRTDLILDDFRERWLAMPAVEECQTIGENWRWCPSQEAMCQCLPVPAVMLPSAVLGIEPLAPGFRRARFAPSLGNLDWAEGVVPTPMGDIRVRVDRGDRGLHSQVEAPAGMEVVRNNSYQSGS